MRYDEDDEFCRCPFCKDEVDEHGRPKGMLVVLHDWANMHSREELVHCWDCDRKFIFYYKIDKIVELVEDEMEFWPERERL